MPGTLYPAQIDTTTTLPNVKDGVTPMTGDVVNRLRDAIVHIEFQLGVLPSSVYGTVRNRLDALESIISNIHGGGNVVSNGPATRGQTLIWSGTFWVPSTDFIDQNIQTSGELVSGPALSTDSSTGLTQLTGKLIFNQINLLNVDGYSDPGQGIIYFDSVDKRFLVSENGGDFFPLTTSGGLAGGDLNGSYPNPSVVKINGATIPVSGSLITGNTLQVNGSSSLTYGPINLAGGSNYIIGTLPNTNQQAQNLSGDLSGNTLSAVVTGLNSVPLSVATPLPNQFLQYNGTFWIPADPSVTLSGDVTGASSSNTVVNVHGASVPVAGSLTTGNILQVIGSSSLSYAPLNLSGGSNFITGTLPSANQQSQSLGGDLSGTTASATVTKIQNNTVTSGSLTKGQFFVASSTSNWAATTLSGDVTESNTTAGQLTVVGVQGNTFTSGSPNKGQFVVATSTTNYGPVTISGDVSESNTVAGQLTVNAINGITVSGTPSSGQIITAISSSLASWQNPITFTAGGDLSGSLSSQTVIGIQNFAVSSTAPTTNQVLQYNGSVWIPATITSSGSAGGDLSGTYPNPTVARVNGATVPSSGSLVTGNVLQVTGSSTLSYAPINLAGGSNFVTGTLPSGNQASQTMGGDVSGTTGSATVTKIQGNTFTSGSPTKGQFVVATTTSSYGPVTISGDVSESGTTAGLLTVIALRGNSVASGTLGAAQDGYVLTWINGSNNWAAAPIGTSVTLGGDVTGSATSNTVTAIRHNTVQSGVLGASQDGYVLTWVNADNMLEMKPSSGSFTAGGDLTGTNTNQTITKIQGHTVNTASLGAAQDGYVLTWINGSSDWEAKPVSVSFTAGGDLSGTSSSQTVVAIRGHAVVSQSLGASQDGYVLTWDNTDGYWKAEPSTSGETNLAGDVTGPEGANVISKIQGNGITLGTLGSVQDGYFLSWNNTDNALEMKPGPSGSFSAGGDLTGSSSNQTVAEIQGNVVDLGTLGSAQDGYVLTWNNTDNKLEMEPGSSNPSLLGDVTGVAHSNVISKIQNNVIDLNGLLGALQDGYVLTWNNTDSKLEMSPPNANLDGDVTGTLNDSVVGQRKNFLFMGA